MDGFFYIYSIMLAIIEVSTGIYVLETQKVTPYTHQLHVDGNRVGVWENYNKSYIGNNALQNFDQYLDPTGTPYATLDALLIDLNTFFFDVSQSGGGETWDGTVDTFAELPSAASNTGAIYLVRQKTGSQLTFNLRRSGFYESDGTNWNKISQVQFMFSDDELTFSDDVDNTKQLGFQLSGISTGVRRVITWQDKDYTPADEADLQQEITDRTNADSSLQLQITQNANDVATNAASIATNAANIAVNAGNIATNAASIAQEIVDRTNADNTLQNNIDAEALTRQAVDEGSVTVHGDVSDAGSGEIITSQERTDINASIDVHSDVNLGGVTIFDGTSFKVSGGQLVPTLKQVFTNPLLIINNTNVLTDVINVNVNIQRLVPHIITISYGWSLNDGAQDFVSEASLGGLNLITGLTDNTEIHRQEPKDVAGGDPDGRGTNQRHRFMGRFFVTPASLGANNLLLQMSGSANGDLASIWNTIIEIEEYVTIS